MFGIVSFKLRIPSPKSRGLFLCAPGRIPAVDALVAGAAPDHDRAAGRARWRVFLILNRRKRIRWCGALRRRGSRRRGQRQLFGVTILIELAAVYARVKLRLGG